MTRLARDRPASPRALRLSPPVGDMLWVGDMLPVGDMLVGDMLVGDMVGDMLPEPEPGAGAVSVGSREFSRLKSTGGR